MSPRLDVDPIHGARPGDAAAVLDANSAIGAPSAPLAVFDADADLGNALPRDHPAWTRDTLSLSQRARTLLATLKPIAVRVVAAWEHRARSIVVGGNRLGVDASGCYRLT